MTPQWTRDEAAKKQWNALDFPQQNAIERLAELGEKEWVDLFWIVSREPVLRSLKLRGIVKELGEHWQLTEYGRLCASWAKRS